MENPTLLHRDMSDLIHDQPYIIQKYIKTLNPKPCRDMSDLIHDQPYIIQKYIKTLNPKPCRDMSDLIHDQPYIIQKYIKPLNPKPCRDMSDLIHDQPYIIQYIKTLNPKPCRDMSDLIYDQPYIIQKYIKDPLTIGGFKFDLRLYVLVPTFQPMKAYLYDEGLVRFATEKYTCDQSTDLSNVYSHLTNSSINKFSPSLNENKAGIGPGCKWPLSRLLKYLEDRNMDTASIMQRIKNIIVLTLLAVWPKVPAQSSGFELLGFDVMLDSQLDPWLIEVNASPALATDTQLDMQVKAPLLSDTLKVLSIGPLPVDEKKSGRRPLSHPPPSSMNSNNAASMRRASPSSSAGTTLPRSSLRPPGLQGGGATSTMGRSGGPPRDPRASMLRRGVGGGGGGGG
jgi:hypothetical protein